MAPVIIVTALLLCIPALMLVYYIFYEPLRVFFRFLFLNTAAKLSIEDVELLEKKFPFYKLLSPENKIRFERRVAFFLHYKKFEGDEIEVTEEMKLLIAACAIQLTFGLRNFWITEFDNIVIEDDSYYLKGIEQKAMGHISPASGTVTLSWKKLQEGINNPTDGLNVGLHEMAHALMINSTEKGWNMSFAAEYDNWEKDAKVGWYEKKESSEFFREYAYTNLYEFFAVAVEYFFEKSKDFSTKEPQLYIEMERLLRLNPMNTSDPVLHALPHVLPSQKIPLPQYSVAEIFKMIFEGPKNFLCFIAGSIATGVGVYLLWIAFSGTNGGYGVIAGFIFLVALFFYVQVFYDDKQSNK